MSHPFKDAVIGCSLILVAKKIIKGFDLDALLFIKKSPAKYSITYNASIVTLPDQHGLGIHSINI